MSATPVRLSGIPSAMTGIMTLGERGHSNRPRAIQRSVMKRGQAMTLMPQLLDRGAANPMLMGMALSSWAKSRQT